MKKLLSLLLALMMALGCLSAAAEEPAADPAAENAAETAVITLPLSFEAFKTRYEALFAALVPDTVISWQDMSTETDAIMAAVVDNAFVGVLVLLDGDNVVELVTHYANTLTVDNMQSFLAISSYACAALLLEEAAVPADVMNASIAAVYALFTATLEGTATHELFSVPAMIDITSEDGTNYEFTLFMSLYGDAAPADTAADPVGAATDPIGEVTDEAAEPVDTVTDPAAEEE